MREFTAALRSARHGDFIHIDANCLLPATHQFNPSLGVADGEVWMVYRRVDLDEWLNGPRRIGLCRLGRDLQPDPASNIDLSERIVDPPNAKRWHADPRMFSYSGRLWFSYHDNYSLYVAPLEPLCRAVRPIPVNLRGRARRERERNWGFFHDGTLKAVYTIPQHVVLGLTETDGGLDATPICESVQRLPWDTAQFGEPHGGSMPVYVEGLWYAFFQSATFDVMTEHRRYFVGMYAFRPEPPHNIVAMTTKPILDGNAFDGPRSFFKGWAVVYPSGAIFDSGRWVVSLGIHDRRLAIRRFPTWAPSATYGAS